MLRNFIFKHMNRLWGGRTSHFGFYWDMYKCAIEGMNYAWGDYAVKNLSETNIFRLLDERSGDDIVMFDGGAHGGAYTLNFMEYFGSKQKHITIHAFEPMKNSMEIYKEKVAGLSGVDISYSPYGLSDREGTADIFFNNDTSIIASLYKRQLDYFDIGFDNHEQIQTTTVDRYCEENHIDRISLLKIVVEGSEYSALTGAEKMISEGRIMMIQFGFGGTSIDSRHFFRDYWNFFRSHDYGLYRVMKDGVIRMDKYDEGFECFHYINFLAVCERD